MANEPSNKSPDEAELINLLGSDWRERIIRTKVDPGHLLSIERSAPVLPSVPLVRLNSELKRVVERNRLSRASKLFPFAPQHAWDRLIADAVSRVPLECALGWPKFPSNVPLDTSFSVNHRVVFAAAPGPLLTLKADDGRLVVVDRDRFASVVLCVLLVWLGGESGAILAAWLIMHQALEPGSQFPELEYLLGEFFHAYPDPLWTVADRLAQVLIGHEIGHSYPEVGHAAFLELVRPESLPLPQDAPWKMV
jgi:hypothetical protein